MIKKINIFIAAAFVFHTGAAFAAETLFTYSNCVLGSVASCVVSDTRCMGDAAPGGQHWCCDLVGTTRSLIGAPSYTVCEGLCGYGGTGGSPVSQGGNSANALVSCSCSSIESWESEGGTGAERLYRYVVSNRKCVWSGISQYRCVQGYYGTQSGPNSITCTRCPCMDGTNSCGEGTALNPRGTTADYGTTNVGGCRVTCNQGACAAGQCAGPAGCFTYGGDNVISATTCKAVVPISCSGPLTRDACRSSSGCGTTVPDNAYTPDQCKACSEMQYGECAASGCTQVGTPSGFTCS